MKYGAGADREVACNRYCNRIPLEARLEFYGEFLIIFMAEYFLSIII